MGTHNYNFTEQFEFTGKPKMLSIIGIVIGLAAIGYGLSDHELHERTFANLLLMAYYFAFVCMSGAFFLALQYVAQAGWSASILRVPQAMARTLPLAAVVLVLVIGAGLYTHNLYHHWNAPGLTDPSSEHYDKLIAGKSDFLNIPFFMAREIVFLAIYSFFAVMFAKNSVNEDLEGGLNYYNKNFKSAVVFLALYGFTTPIFAFDTIMSIEAHWFSTMFGWYNFASMWVSCLAIIAVILILLKKSGYMPWVNNSHLHNLGQFIFGFSIFWTYTWFCQFLLIYYANMPEETVYFYKRLEYYKFWFYLNLLLNFLVPVFLLMDRDNKRSENVLLTVSILIICGHWVDLYQMIMPGSVESHNGFGFIEVGIAAGFIGLFTFAVLSALSKQPLVAKNHPFLEESLNHHL
ncbi:quinol:cytochrome C oxidoreductase [Pedobacter sp. SAFR-022]|uniref:quinol:cytochrome C oxidoreductase n=1 Tax=Pedobacter sp. SAFR-022 TaxID=3436861 RepID=UPI003F7FBE96